MRIAFVSYEFPPDTADGGVATYIEQISKLLTARGHQVEVFAASTYRSGAEVLPDGTLVHRVLASRQTFGKLVVEPFLQRNETLAFDVLEGVDRFAHCSEILKYVPAMPFVLKLHTPGIVLREINLLRDFTVPGIVALKRLKVLLQLARRKWNPYWRWAPPSIRKDIFDDVERIQALQADEIVALCADMADLISKAWGVERQMISVVPLPLHINPALLSVPPDLETNTVVYIGRLEFRKGVLDLARAIPIVLAAKPGTKFRFVGRAMSSPDPDRDMDVYLSDWLHPYLHAIEFTGAVSLEQIPDVLREADISVVPSIWENFPFVLRESMAAARAVVATRAGGMKDIVSSPQVGCLVPPENPRKLAEAIIDLLEHPAKRIEMGRAARALMVGFDNADVINLVEASFQRAIVRRGQLGAR